MLNLNIKGVGLWVVKEPWGYNLKLTPDNLEFMMKSKRKKKVVGVFKGSFSRNFVGGGYSFFFSSSGVLWKKFTKPYSTLLKFLNS